MAGSAEYNTGSEDDRRTALGAVIDLTKLLIAICTGTVVLSATFLEKFYAGYRLEYLTLSWICLGLSVLLGFLAFGMYISQFAESDLLVRRGFLELLSLGQWLTLVIGLGLFALFVRANINAAPVIRVDRALIRITDRGHIMLSVECRARTVCMGTAALARLGRGHAHNATAAAPFEIDGTGNAVVTLRPSSRVAQLLRSRSRSRIRITVAATDALGHRSRYASTLELSSGS